MMPEQEDFLSFDFDAFEGMDIDVNIDVEEESEEFQNELLHARLATVKKNHVLYDNAEKLAKAIEAVPGFRVDAILSGNFIFGDFIEAFIVENDAHAERMVISTLSVNEENVASLDGLMELGYVDNLDLLVSGYFFRNERNNLIPYIMETLGQREGFRLVVTALHTKTVHFKTDGGKHIVMHGSANLRASASIEQVTIEDNRDLFEFYDRVLGKIARDYAVNGKCRERNQLWDLIDRKEI